VSRSLIDITALDLRIQEQIAEYGSLKEFHITVWRQARDSGGATGTPVSIASVAARRMTLAGGMSCQSCESAITCADQRAG
jgi:hypothetical protein